MDFNFNPSENSKDVLKKYAKNLNEEIENGKGDPVVGRDEEIRRLIEIISRKTKNNPVLIGEPGVGKTAIVEGFVQRIVNGDVPDDLKDKVVYELSVSALLSGASFQGQFEERLNNVIKQVRESDGNTILFIDEIHLLVGAGRNGNSGMDAANILKPAMARGDIKIIGATTLNEYRQYIEKDTALERRMQKIYVAEPTEQEALTIMRGLKERWEMYHKVKIHDSALIAAVKLSNRYISDRFLPDKAIDLVDEAAAKVKTEMHSLPVELDSIKRNIIHLETERASLLNENDTKSKKRLESLETELKELKMQQEEQTKIWENQKNERDKVSILKKELESAKVKMEKLQSDGKFEDASKLLYVTIPQLQQKLNDYENEDNSKNVARDAVTEREIAEVVSKTTGIPLNKVIDSEKVKLLSLNDELKLKVKGQDEAVDVVANAILRGRAGVNDPNRPLGSFLFMGSTGVGKTELAKALAFELFHSDKSIARFDMSEYMEKHSVSKLIGAPPGYVGYEQSGGLTEIVRRRPYTVLLFDEIEKAHPDVLNLLLQVLDDGRLRDAQGHDVNFKNTLIIMTSNIGAQSIIDGDKEKALIELKKSLKPEFINRIDEIIVFNTLNNEAINEVVEKMLNDLINRLSLQDLKISFDKSVVKKIKEDAYDPIYGARPIKRYIQKNIENLLASKIISKDLEKNKQYIIVLDKDNKFALNLRKKN